MNNNFQEVDVKVPSFSVDHLTMDAGLYLRENRWISPFTRIKVWDLRFRAPRDKSYMSSAVLHTIEHIMAFKLRAVLGFKYISFFPFGCCTGFGFISKSSLSYDELKDALIEVIEHTLPIFTSNEIPALTPKECGRPTLYSIKDTNTELANYRNVLESL